MRTKKSSKKKSDGVSRKLENKGAVETGTKTILEYFEDVDHEGGRDRALFSAEDDDIDMKTDVDEQEILYFSTMRYNDAFLEACGIGAVYRPFIDPRLRLKISKSRKSREEFVTMNKHDHRRVADDVLERASLPQNNK